MKSHLILQVIIAVGWIASPCESGMIKAQKEVLAPNLAQIRKPNAEANEKAPDDTAKQLVMEYAEKIKVRSKLDIKADEDQKELNNAKVEAVGFLGPTVQGPYDNYYIRVIIGQAFISHVKISTVRGVWKPKNKLGMVVGSMFTKFRPPAEDEADKGSHLAKVIGNKGEDEQLSEEELNQL